MGANQRKVYYEPHPVSHERKAELRAAGYTIVDAKFAPPASRISPEAEVVKRAPARKLVTKGVE